MTVQTTGRTTQVGRSSRNAPTMTFVVPVYNAVAWLPVTLHSLMAQTYKRIEIIVVNDGSTDSIQELMAHYCKKDKRIRYVHGDGVRRGAAYRRNQGNKLARTDLICVADAGDEYHALKAEIVREHFMRNPQTDLLYHSVKIVDLEGRDLRMMMAYPPMLRQYPRGISHPTVTYRRECILKHPYRTDCLDTDQYEAMLLTFQQAGYTFDHVRNILLKKREMHNLRDYRDMRNASLKKIQIYKEFGVKIEPWLYRRAGVKPNARLPVGRRSRKVPSRPLPVRR